MKLNKKAPHLFTLPGTDVENLREIVAREHYRPVGKFWVRMTCRQELCVQAQYMIVCGGEKPDET